MTDPAHEPEAPREAFSPETPRALERLGGYTIQGALGAGPTGAVFRGRAADGREVAIKLLPSLGARPPTLSRLARERGEPGLDEAAGFVPLLGEGQAELGRYVVWPYLAEGSLQARLREGPLPVAEAVALGIRLARALAAAHAQGVVHRDLKPTNVLFRPDGRALLADLGVGFQSVRAVQGSAPGDVGELRYLAPEQLARTRGAGAAADVFALGALLYEALAGTAPFPPEGRGPEEASPRPLGELRPQTPPWLTRLITSCLAPDPGRRPSAAKLVQLLREPGERERSGSLRLATVAGVTVVSLAGLLVLALPARPAAPEPEPAPATPSPAPEPALVSRSAWQDPQPGAIAALAASPDGDSLLSASAGGELGLWGLKEARCLRRYRGGRQAPRVAVFGLAGLRLLAGEGPRVQVWDLANGAPTTTLAGDGPAVSGLLDLPGGVLSLDDAGTLRLWNRLTGQVLRQAAPAELTRPRVLAEGGQPDSVVTGHADGRVRTWRFLVDEKRTELRPLAELGRPLPRPVVALATRLGSPRVLAAGGDGRIRSWEGPTQAPRWLEGGSAQLRALALSPLDRWVAGADPTGLYLWNLRRGGQPLRVAGDPARGAPTSLCFGRDGSLWVGTARGWILRYAVAGKPDD